MFLCSQIVHSLPDQFVLDLGPCGEIPAMSVAMITSSVTGCNQGNVHVFIGAVVCCFVSFVTSTG